MLVQEFDIEALKEYDGADGKPAYVVHKGRVFDLSGSRLWKGGVHMMRHHAGQDLTVDIGGAPHGPEVLERYPQVGVIRSLKVPERVLPDFLTSLLERFPFLRRHPHPMTVHFPIVFMLSTTFFNVLYLITGDNSFERTALHCLGSGVFFTPFVIGTGIYTWWLNYFAKPMPAIKIKLTASICLFLVGLTAFIWRRAVPDLCRDLSIGFFLYALLILLLTPIVVIIGWFGANLTFPLEKE